MASTPRKHRFQLPMATRSTDVSMMHDCPGRWTLTHLRQPEQAEASFFILGTQLHETIEVAINLDLDEDWALQHLRAGIDRELERIADAPHKIESSKRGFDTMHEDAERMLRQWFTTVHPDSDKRLDAYANLSWPPETEVAFMRGVGTAYPIWGSIDAVFKTDASHVIIVDWKSGTSRQRTDDQLHFYRYGIGMQGATAWFHHLDKVQARAIIQMAEPYPGDAHVRQRILATEAIKDSIIDGEYPHFNPSFLCNYCPVQHLCPADGDVRNREQNAFDLRRMLRLVRPMIEMPEAA